MVDGEAEESGTIPYTISEKSGLSYGSGRGGVVGSLIISPSGLFRVLRITISCPHLLSLNSL